MTALLAGYVVLVRLTGLDQPVTRDLSWDGELYDDLADARRNLEQARAAGLDVELGVVAAVPDAAPVDQIAEVGVTLRMRPRYGTTITMGLPVAQLPDDPAAEPPADR